MNTNFYNRDYVYKINCIAHMISLLCKIYDFDKIELIKLLYKTETYKNIIDGEFLYIKQLTEVFDIFTKELIENFGFEMKPYKEWHETYITN